MSLQFETEEATSDGKPLFSGLFLDVGAELDKESAIMKAVRKMQTTNPDFKPPFIVMDLATKEEVKIKGEASYGDDADDTYVSEDYAMNPSVKMLVPCSQVVDLSKIGGIAGSTSIVKCNAMTPVYRWFQSANLLLHFADKTGRLVPFPLDQDDGVTYHMLPVTPAEFRLYQQVLEYGTTEQGLERGFGTSARFSYELLHKRGIENITADEVDAVLCHIMVGHMNGVCEGVLLHRASREDLEGLGTSHFIHY
jgi:hypothetical protein